MVNAVNQLIKEITSEKLDENLDISWFDEKRKVKLQLLIKNLERVRSYPNLDDLQLKRLTSFLYILLKYYKKKIEYKELLRIYSGATSKKINDEVDSIILKLRNLTTSIFVENIIRELLQLGVNQKLINEALTIPELHRGINEIKLHIKNSINNFSSQSLDKEVIFKLCLIRIAAHCNEEKLDIPKVQMIRKQFDSEGKPSSYEMSKKVCVNIKDFTLKLNNLYENYKKLFLARDGFILYEAQLTLYKNSSDIIYVSRDTLGKYFKFLNNKLDESINKEGINNVGAIITDLHNNLLKLYNSDEEIKSLFNSLIRYLKSYLDVNTVFVDSSSRSLPVILCAICKIFYPKFDFRVYFFSTIYQDTKAGYLLGQKENYIVDMMPEYVEFDKERSSIIPYIQKLLPIKLRTGKMKQPQAYMVHLVLQSVLHS